MKLLIGLINLLIWWAIPLFLLFAFSFAFFYGYKDAVQAPVFIVAYVIYMMIIGFMYGSFSTDRDNSMDFIKRN